MYLLEVAFFYDLER